MQVVKDSKVLGEKFSGSANYQEEAKMNADIKYHLWCSRLKKRGQAVIELERSYSFKQVNDVYWKCDLRVNFRIIPR